MHYIIEWNEELIHKLNKNLGKSAWGPLPQFGLTANITSSKPVYIFFKGASNRENIFIKGSYVYSPPMIDTYILDRGDKTWIKNSIKNGTMKCLSKDVTIEAIKEAIDVERCEREKAYVPDSIKPFIVKLNMDNILHDCTSKKKR